MIPSLCCVRHDAVGCRITRMNKLELEMFWTAGASFEIRDAIVPSHTLVKPATFYLEKKTFSILWALMADSKTASNQTADSNTIEVAG